MKKLITLIVLTLAALSTAAQQNPQLAEAEWAAAEQAYAAGRYEDALRHLDKTQEYAGQWIFTISHLRLLCYDKLDAYSNEQYLSEFVAEVNRYVEYDNDNSNSNSSGFDNNRYHEYKAIYNKLASQDEYNEGYALYEAGNYTQAIPKLQVAAENGWEFAMYVLGNAYLFGKGVTTNEALALEWMKKAADKNFVAAIHYVGMMYFAGHGVTQDCFEAARYYRRAADKGYVDAMYDLGTLYLLGGCNRSFSEDKTQAIEWMRKAAENGHEEAKRVLELDW